MKAEVGGAFVLSWAVFAMGIGTLQGAVALAVVWMAFSGAHVLPVVTWCHMLNDGDGDVEGNYMPNGMRLVAQAVGALLAIVLATEAGGIETGWAAAEFAVPEIWPLLTTVAAGAVWWQVHTRCDSAWASAFGIMILGGMMVLTGAHEMGASIASAGDGIADVLPAWIVDGLLVGIGARVGAEIDKAV
ncbi:MAG TPA: hypothetical protein QF703_02615 [Candidatus Thalassarchaeaceae archaeon]|nr:hypothetical protein [Candidatus Thalassarchaeaceae archaeon]